MFGMYINPSTGKILGVGSVALAMPPAAASSGLRGNYGVIITPNVVQQVRMQGFSGIF